MILKNKIYTDIEFLDLVCNHSRTYTNIDRNVKHTIDQISTIINGAFFEVLWHYPLDEADYLNETHPDDTYVIVEALYNDAPVKRFFELPSNSAIIKEALCNDLASTHFLMLGRHNCKSRMLDEVIKSRFNKAMDFTAWRDSSEYKDIDRMFDINILGFNFYCNYDRMKYSVVEIEAEVAKRNEFGEELPFAEFEEVYDDSNTIADIVKDFVDKLWKELYKEAHMAYEIRLYITLTNSHFIDNRFKYIISHEFKKRLAIKREEDKICRALSNSRFGIISYDVRHMYPVPIIPESNPFYGKDMKQTFIDETLLDTTLADSILDTCKYIQEIAKDREKAKQKIKEYEKMKIENVIFNDPATIVFWRDGSKTVVKAKDEPYDPEKGLAMAIAKKVYGNEGNYYNEFRKFIKEMPKEDNTH